MRNVLRRKVGCLYCPGCETERQACPESTSACLAARSDAEQSSGSAPTAMPGRVPWQSVGTGVVSIGAPLGVAVLRPLLGEVVTAVELVVILTVLGTALFGSQTLSERAFRLLRWPGNRPEPPAPDDTARTRTPPHPAKGAAGKC